MLATNGDRMLDVTLPSGADGAVVVRVRAEDDRARHRASSSVA